MTRLSRELVVVGLVCWLALAPTAATASDETSDEASDAVTSAPSSPAPAEETPEPSPAAATAPAPTATATTTPPVDAAEPDDQLPEPEAPDDEPTQLVVDDAELRWGVNNESNNRAFAPGTYNYLSAGKVPNPGRGYSILPESSWSGSSGSVSLEKWDGDAYRPATWAGLRTSPTGAPLGNGVFSGHELVFADGTGTIDLESQDAEIAWDGDATVVYYSGYSFFYLSDPVLTVDDGVGTVTAELGGYASSMDDLTQWEPVDPERVTIADLGAVELTAGGFTATPRYDGVRVSGPDVFQVQPYGSFPQSFVDWQTRSGTGAYWYSSGGAADRWKKALPMAFGYQGRAATPEAPVTGTPAAPISNDALAPPAPIALAAAQPAPPATVGAPATAPAAPAATADASTDVFEARPVASITSQLPSAPAAGDALWWWLTTVFLTLAAGCVVGAHALTPSAASTRG